MNLNHQLLLLGVPGEYSDHIPDSIDYENPVACVHCYIEAAGLTLGGRVTDTGCTLLYQLFRSGDDADESPFGVVNLETYETFFDCDKTFIGQYGKIDGIAAAAESFQISVGKFAPRKFEVPVGSIGFNSMVSWIDYPQQSIGGDCEVKMRAGYNKARNVSVLVFGADAID